ncbi:MAG TPA: glutamate racemase [Treponemataceae bacterium]|nr:glutamate racemase [Treponemataceae bacterium]
MEIDFVFIDSGTGGIPYMLYLSEKYPGYSSMYVADTENFPYGEKTHERIIETLTHLIEKILLIVEPKVIVIACNTMSVTALSALRERFSVPFVGTVPAVKLAGKISTNKRIGLLATERTVQESYTDKLISDFAPDCTVYKRGDAGLVSFIEYNYLFSTKEERYKALEGAHQFFSSRNIDTLILACTHFIHLTKEIQELFGSGVAVIDSREGVVKQAIRLIEGSAVNTDKKTSQKSSAVFYYTGNKDEKTITSYSSLMKNLGVRWGGMLL